MSRVTTVKLNTQFYLVLIDISSWKDLCLNNVYKSYNYITKMDAVKSVYRALRPIYGVHNRPTEHTIRHTIGIPIKPRTARTVENIAAVNESFAEDPEECLSYGTTWAIFDAGN